MSDIDIEHLRNVNTVSRFFKKCSSLDDCLEAMGSPRVAHKEAQKYIKPLMPLADQAREALLLEDTIDGLLAAVKIL